MEILFRQFLICLRDTNQITSTQQQEVISQLKHLGGMLIASGKIRRSNGIRKCVTVRVVAACKIQNESGATQRVWFAFYQLATFSGHPGGGVTRELISVTLLRQERPYGLGGAAQ